jgi:uncharacterized protein
MHAVYARVKPRRTGVGPLADARRRTCYDEDVIEHDAVLMRIYLAESRRHGRTAVFRRLIEELLAAGFRGAAAFRGIEGFGTHRRISADWVVDAPSDLPILIEVADEIERVRAFLPRLEAVLDDGLVTLERVRRVTGQTCASS